MSTKGKRSLTDSPRDLNFQAASGEWGMEVVDVIGWQPVIGTSLIEVWDLAAAWVAPTEARLHDLVSSSVADTDTAGTGVRKVRVEGLDASYNKQNETVLLDGTDDVATANTYTMVNKMFAIEVGSGGAAAGIITATAQTDATVTSQIVVGQNKTFSSVYVVPNGFEAYMVTQQMTINSSSNAAGTVEVAFARQVPFEGANIPLVAGPTIVLSVANTITRDIDIHPYAKLPGKTRISFKADASHITTDVITRVRLILDPAV